MSSNWFITAVALVCVFVSACAPLNPPKPLSAESARQENHFFGLFTIMPPQGDNWYEIVRKAGVLAYKKQLESADHTFIASVQISKTDQSFSNENEFLTFVKIQRASDNSPERFNFLINDEKLDKSRGAYCTQFHQKAEDKAASKSSGSLSILEIKGVSCLHPRQPLIVTVEYSERGNLPFNKPALLNEGEGFVNSLQIK